MVAFAQILGKELLDYVDSLIDNQGILNRTDAVRQIIIDHRNNNKGKK